MIRYGNAGERTCYHAEEVVVQVNQVSTVADHSAGERAWEGRGIHSTFSIKHIKPMVGPFNPTLDIASRFS